MDSSPSRTHYRLLKTPTLVETARFDFEVIELLPVKLFEERRRLANLTNATGRVVRPSPSLLLPAAANTYSVSSCGLVNGFVARIREHATSDVDLVTNGRTRRPRVRPNPATRSKLLYRGEIDLLASFAALPFGCVRTAFVYVCTATM